MMEVRLVCTEEAYRSLREALLPSGDPREQAVLAFLGRGRSGPTLELYLHTLLRDLPCRSRSATSVEIAPQAVLEAFRRFREADLPVFLHAHSHPFTSQAAFSAVDDRFIGQGWRSLAGYLRATGCSRPSFLYARLVMGRAEEGFTGDVRDAAGRMVGEITEVWVVGPQGLRAIRSFRHPLPQPDTPEALDRNRRWMGLGQETLRRLRVGICGAGGVGSQVAFQAVGLGFGGVLLVDPDRLETSNLNRFLGGGWKERGRPKAKVLARTLRRWAPWSRVQACTGHVPERRALKRLLDCALLVSAVDNDIARLHLQVLAARHLRPLLDLGSGFLVRNGRVETAGGQARLYIPGGPCLLCQGLPPSPETEADRSLRQAVGYTLLEGDPTPVPSSVALNAVTAGLGMDLVVRWLLGWGLPTFYVRHDLTSHRMARLPFARRPQCPICGEKGVEARGREETRPPLPRRKALPGVPDA